MPLSNDTKNILKGVGLAAVGFGVLYLIFSRKENEEKKNTTTLNELKAKLTEVSEIVNGNLPSKEAPKDNFVNTDGGKKTSKSEPQEAEIISETISNPVPPPPPADETEEVKKARRAIQWFFDQKYDIDKFDNRPADEIIKRAQSLGWKDN